MLRSHEGPDAREGRDDMQSMAGGYTLDHDTPAGKLMTVFRWGPAPARGVEAEDWLLHRALRGGRGWLKRGHARKRWRCPSWMPAGAAEQSRVLTGPGASPALLLRSAPDYPQFMPDDAERYNNLAAVAVLTAPDWASPNMRQFAAAHPRPEVGAGGRDQGQSLLRV